MIKLLEAFFCLFFFPDTSLIEKNVWICCWTNIFGLPIEQRNNLIYRNCIPIFFLHISSFCVKFTKLITNKLIWPLLSDRKKQCFYWQPKDKCYSIIRYRLLFYFFIIIKLCVSSLSNNVLLLLQLFWFFSPFLFPTIAND